MAVRLFDISKWRTLAAGEVLEYSCDKARNVRIDVCATTYTIFTITVGSREPFNVLLQGRETLELYVDGDFTLSVDEDCSIYSMDGADLSVVAAPDSVIFTRVANFKARNPNLEMMEYRMKVNQNRMLEQLNVELARRDRALEERLETYARQRNIRTPAETVGGKRPEEGVERDGSELPSAAAGSGDEASSGEKSGGSTRGKRGAPAVSADGE